MYTSHSLSNAHRAHARYPSSLYSDDSVDVESLPIFLSSSRMDSPPPTASPQPRVRLPFRAAAQPAGPVWPAHVPAGNKPLSSPASHSRPRSAHADAQSSLATHVHSPHRPPLPLHTLERDESSGSSTDDSSAEHIEPRTPVEESAPWSAAPDAIDDSRDADAAKRDSCFTLSAYLTNSPNATWSSSAENTPVHEAVAQFPGQIALIQDENFSDRRRSATSAAARTDSRPGSGTGSSASSHQNAGSSAQSRQDSRRPALTLVTPSATNDPDDLFTASFRGPTSSSTPSLLNASTSTTSFDPPRAGGKTSTPVRRGPSASPSGEPREREGGVPPDAALGEAPSAASNANVSSPASKRSPQHIYAASPTTSTTATPPRGMPQQRTSTAARSSSVTPTPTPTRSRPGTREGRGRSPASPLAAGPSPSATALHAAPSSTSSPPSRDGYAQAPVALARDGDPSLFLPSTSYKDFVSPSSSMVSSSSRRETPTKRTMLPPGDMTFGDPATSPVRSVAESMRVAAMLPIEILRGHERKESSSSSGSGTNTPTPSRPTTRGAMTTDTRPRSKSQTPSPTKAKGAMLGDDFLQAKQLVPVASPSATRTTRRARPPSPAQSVDTVGTVDDVDFIVSPNVLATAIHDDDDDDDDDDDSMGMHFQPTALIEEARVRLRRPATADSAGMPLKNPARPRTPQHPTSRPSTARERGSPPMFRTTTQGVPTSVSLDSPPLSETGGSPSFRASMSFGSMVVEPLNEAARRRVDEVEMRGLGIGPGSDEWSSRYAGAFRESAKAHHVREQSVGTVASKRPKDPPRPATADPWLASASSSKTALASPPDDARGSFQRATLQPTRSSEMLASAARTFNSIPSRRSARPGTSAGPPASRRPQTATGRPTTADGPASASRLASASPTSELRRDSAASSTVTATTETAIDIKLPKGLAFLTTACVELWIDQEGFRAVRPALWLASSRDGGDLVEFCMRPKQAYVFHHAAFDSAPVLRRLTVNGDESRDYMSRQASLSVKKNGVYTVSGAEDRGRLPWRFEYLVTDRKDIGGRSMSGEKAFTPLSFACAPQLLAPTNGKKVHLLHVMRKSVTPKLAAAQVDPSTTPTSAGQSSSTIGVPILPPDLTNVPLLSDVGLEGSGGRRRAASHSLGRVSSRPWTAAARPRTGGSVYS